MKWSDKSFHMNFGNAAFCFDFKQSSKQMKKLCSFKNVTFVVQKNLPRSKSWKVSWTFMLWVFRFSSPKHSCRTEKFKNSTQATQKWKKRMLSERWFRLSTKKIKNASSRPTNKIRFHWKITHWWSTEGGEQNWLWCTSLLQTLS